jgi:cell division protein FtsZ
VDGAKGILINFTGGLDLSIHEVEEAARVVQQAAHEDANIIFGAVLDPTLNDEIRITVIATGFDKKDQPPVVAGRVFEMPRSAVRPASNGIGAAAGVGAWRRRATEARIEGLDQIDAANDDLDVPAFLRRQAD